jgi:hypothetical protein|nr:MAG TPA: ASCH domain protein [Caudoviricetes sp.]
MAIKPILFNTEMVQAILGGRKSCTRRLVKYEPQGYFEVNENPVYIYDTDWNQGRIKPPYQPGDILYVRETFIQAAAHIFWYKADDKPWMSKGLRWKPSIHMPKEAARIWLKVTDVRVERLQEIDEDGVWNEGFRFTPPCLTRVSADGHTCDLDGPCTSHIKYCDMTMGELFGRELWNSTIKKSDLDRYGWDAKPWVWVIEFERCEKPEA